MIIANPIYDSAFKYLMEDAEVARRLIGAIIGKEIVSLEPMPQERSETSPQHFLTVYRLDFKAIIRTEEGDTQKVLIELQKSKVAFDILRFRSYLGDNYRQTEEIDGEKRPLPLVPIYLLGFKLSIPVPLLKIGRCYTDISTGETVPGKDEFIEQLSHDCFIIQIPCLTDRMQTKVEKLLSVFNQKWAVSPDQQWVLRYPQEYEKHYKDKDLKRMLKRLNAVIQSTDYLKNVEAETQLDEFIARQLRQEQRKSAEKEIALKKMEQERVRIEQERERAEQERERAEQERERAEQERERAEQERERAEQERERAEQERERAEQEREAERMERQRAEQERETIQERLLEEQREKEDLLRRLRELESKNEPPPKNDFG